jgi:hypothetical protein
VLSLAEEPHTLMEDETTSSEVLMRFDEPGTGRAVVLEDDGRVAYAYLLTNEKIVGDVWLYNVAQGPHVVRWDKEEGMPFLNPKPFCVDQPVRRLTDDSSVVCTWSELGVEVEVDGVPWARLETGAKPGWSRMAARPSPVARPLTKQNGL